MESGQCYRIQVFQLWWMLI